MIWLLTLFQGTHRSPVAVGLFGGSLLFRLPWLLYAELLFAPVTLREVVRGQKHN